MKSAIIGELKNESALTRKMLEKVPLEKANWKPHEKSMSLGRLATHIAQIPHWISDILLNDDYDFNEHSFMNNSASSQQELMSIFEEYLDKAMSDLEHADEASLEDKWTVRRGEHVFSQSKKKTALRSWALNHFIHHRGQLSVYLRLLDVAVPGMYGPSADEKRNL